MGELGYDLSRHSSKSVAELADIEFDVAVMMGCGDECPLIMAKAREDWEIPDPRDMPLPEFREVRSLIQQKVQELLRRL